MRVAVLGIVLAASALSGGAAAAAAASPPARGPPGPEALAAVSRRGPSSSDVPVSISGHAAAATVDRRRRRRSVERRDYDAAVLVGHAGNVEMEVAWIGAPAGHAEVLLVRSDADKLRSTAAGYRAHRSVDVSAEASVDNRSLPWENLVTASQADAASFDPVLSAAALPVAPGGLAGAHDLAEGQSLGWPLDAALAAAPWPVAAGGRETASPATLRLDLCLRGVTLKDLHNSSHGSLAEFLLELGADLAKAEGFQDRHVSVLGIRGRHRHVSEGAVPQKDDHEVVVKLEVTDFAPSNLTLTSDQVVPSLSRRLQSGALRLTAFGFAVQNVTITESMQKDPLASLGAQSLKTLGSMAVPIATSAALTGLLLWAAAR